MRQGLTRSLARQYAQQAMDHAGQGKVVGTMAAAMKRIKGLGGSPDTSGSGGTS